jgi:hypothetical protein
MAAKKKAAKKKAAKKKRGRKPKEKPADEGALRAGYLERYAGRDASKRLSRLRTDMHIGLGTLDRWMSDPSFCEQIAGIDARRLKSAEGLATTLWPAIVEKQAEIATCVLPDPPKEPRKGTKSYAFQCRLLLAGHQAACAAAVKSSTRAAEFVGKYLNLLRESQVNVFGADAETFGRLTDLKTPAPPSAKPTHEHRAAA